MRRTPPRAWLGITRRKLLAVALIALGYGLASWLDTAEPEAPLTVTREIVVSGGLPWLRTCLQRLDVTRCTYRESRGDIHDYTQ